MRRPLILVLAFLLLGGCNPVSTRTPVNGVTATNTSVPSPMPAVTAATSVATLTRQPTAAAVVTLRPAATVQASPSSLPPRPAFSYPIGLPGQLPGDGFFLRHAAGVENTWFNPGYWHTGEDWYAVAGDSSGAQVYAIADGQVVYVGANYPGRVVIVEHSSTLYSMYGHLDPQVAVQDGDQVARGTLLGTVLRRSDAVPNHLHFELRSFFTQPEVNGDSPRYGFRCGVNCPPGPGYWPIAGPELPGALGWFIPTHVIARRAYPADANARLGELQVAMQPVSAQAEVWSQPPEVAGRSQLGSIDLQPGMRFPLLQVFAGPEQAEQTSALAYQLWYEIELPDQQHVWVQAAIASNFETGSDGRPSTVYFQFFPVPGP